jgi:hypothetical protein
LGVPFTYTVEIKPKAKEFSEYLPCKQQSELQCTIPFDVLRDRPYELSQDDEVIFQIRTTNDLNLTSLSGEFSSEIKVG